MHIALSELSPNQVYATLTQTIIPRPVAWVLSENADGGYNLAPFSYFNAMASDPPMIVLSIGLKASGEEKDTRVNLRERQYFTVHIAHREQAAALTLSSATLPSGVSELDGLDLPLADMPGSRIPRIRDCRIAFACKLLDTRTIGRQQLMFAEISDLYVDDAVIGRDGKGRLKILARKVDPIGRLGGGEYVTFGEILDIPRPA